jgi:cob(I)alamin adenosyltransferase
VTELEAIIDRLEGQLPPLRNFILPGGGELASRLHQARTVVRRAERRVVAASAEAEFNPEVVPFLNRLSDLLFVLARYVNLRAGGEDEAVDWRV